MSLALAFLKRDYRIAASYKTAFLLQLLTIFAAVPLLYFVGKLFGGSDAGFLKAYHGDYFAFLLIGVAFLDYHAVSLSTFSTSLRESQLMGTLELVLLSPTSLTKVLIYSSFWVYFFTTIRFVLYIALGFIMDLNLAGANLPGAMVILFLGVLSFAAFGVFAASIIMIFKRGGGVNTFLSGASLFFGGVLYPTDVLPHWLQPVCKMLPITYALEGMRAALLQKATIAELMPNILILIAFAVVLLPLSLVCFWLAVQRTKVTGTLAQY